MNQTEHGFSETLFLFHQNSCMKSILDQWKLNSNWLYKQVRGQTETDPL